MNRQTFALVSVGLTSGRGLPRSEGSTDPSICSYTGSVCGVVALTAMTVALRYSKRTPS